MSKIEVMDTNISLKKNKVGDYISLTDMAKYKKPDATGLVISHWLSTRFAIEFLGIWESVNNPNFNVTEFSNIKANAGANGNVLSAKQWIDKTNAIGIVSSAGRYGGTYAHSDIAFEFGSWLSPEFKYYRIHTDAIKQNLIPATLTSQETSIVYANEADVLNMALFGKTAATWRSENPDTQGNIRDYASINQLICLSNMESLNSVLINEGLPQSERLVKLNQIAISQMPPRRMLRQNACIHGIRQGHHLYGQRQPFSFIFLKLYSRTSTPKKT